MQAFVFNHHPRTFTCILTPHQSETVFKNLRAQNGGIFLSYHYPPTHHEMQLMICQPNTRKPFRFHDKQPPQFLYNHDKQQLLMQQHFYIYAHTHPPLTQRNIMFNFAFISPSCKQVYQGMSGLS